MLCLAQVALTPLACASFSIPMICSSLNLLFISFCSFYLSRTTLFNCPAFGGQARVTHPFVKNCTLRPRITRRTGVNPTSQVCSWAGPRSDQDCPASPAITSSGTIFLQPRDLTYNFLQMDEGPHAVDLAAAL